MAHILLALDAENQSRIIHETLLATHQVTAFDPAHSAPCAFDLCIVDQAQWSTVNNWLASKQHTSMPRLFAGTCDVIDNLSPDIICHVDDVIRLPIHANELTIRVAALLKSYELARKQASLQERLTIINTAIESTSDAINIADVNGTSVYTNAAFLNMYQYSTHDLNSGGIPKVLFVDPRIGTHIFGTVRRKGSWRGEVELRSKDGHVIQTLLFLDKIMDENNHELGYIGVCTNINHRKRIEMVQREQRVLAEALRDTASALTSTLNFDEVITRILENIGKVVPHDAANIILIEQDIAYLVRSHGYHEDHPLQRFSASQTPVNELHDLQTIRESGIPLVIPNTEHYAGLPAQHTPWLNSHIGSPIFLGGEVIGFLNVDCYQPDVFHKGHAEYMQLFVEQAGIAIQNARLHEKAQLLAAIQERQRLARDLHDAVSQTLFSASLMAESLMLLWDKRPDEMPARLKQLHLLTRGALAEMRTLLLELHPERLLRTQLDELIFQIVNAVKGQKAIDIQCHVAQVKSLPTTVRVAMYYIVQEAFNNIVKHAEASTAIVQLSQTNGQVSLLISDNGSGFDPQRAEMAGLGLDNMRERARSVGADLQISSEIGQGTKVAVNWSSNIET